MNAPLASLKSWDFSFLFPMREREKERKGERKRKSQKASQSKGSSNRLGRKFYTFSFLLLFRSFRQSSCVTCKYWMNKSMYSQLSSGLTIDLGTWNKGTHHILVSPWRKVPCPIFFSLSPHLLSPQLSPLSLCRFFTVLILCHLSHKKTKEDKILGHKPLYMSHIFFYSSFPSFLFNLR